MMAEGKRHRFRIKPPRRLVQLGVIVVLIGVPFYTQNPLEWSPSRIVLGHLPKPRVFPLSGDTWSFSIGGFTLTHPVAFIEEVLSSKVVYQPLLISALIPLVLTLVLGRVFCSWLCPVGFLLELNQKVNSLFRRAGLHLRVRIKDLRYTILALALVLVFFFAFPILSIFDPPHLFGRELMYIFTHGAVSLSGAGLLLGIFLLDLFFAPRVWCRSLCPSGGALSLLGARRLWRIRMDAGRCTHCGYCDEACPYGLEPMGLAEAKGFDWLKCDNCGLCRDVCPTGALSYRFDLKGG